MQRLFLWVFILGVTFGIGHLAWTIIRARKRTENAIGMVVNVSWGWGSEFPRPHVEFVDRDGIRREFRSKAGATWDPWPDGTQVEVSYDPNDPADAELALSEMWHILVIMFIVLGILLAFGFFMLSNAP